MTIWNSVFNPPEPFKVQECRTLNPRIEFHQNLIEFEILRFSFRPSWTPLGFRRVENWIPELSLIEFDRIWDSEIQFSTLLNPLKEGSGRSKTESQNLKFDQTRSNSIMGFSVQPSWPLKGRVQEGRKLNLRISNSIKFDQTRFWDSVFDPLEP